MVKRMKHGSLFSGIGGFDLAAEWMGWENVFHCEINPFGQKILKHYWPEAELIDDITKFDFKKYEGAIDIISGGFPCQPFSLAGKRKGTEDDRHLWPEMLRVIREVRPSWVVGENVFGIINWDGGLVFDQVQSDLEAEGYEVQPYVLPAVSVNAPHRRDRTWFVAYCNNRNGEKVRLQAGGEINMDRTKRNRTTSDTDSLRHRGRRDKPGANKPEEREMDIDTDGDRNGIWCKTERCGGTASDPCNERLQGSKLNGTFGGEKREHDEPCGATPKRHEIQTWDNWPTQSPICSRDDEFPDRLDGITFSKWRNESIKAYGNAVVPVLGYQIFKAIEEYETLLNNC